VGGALERERELIMLASRKSRIDTCAECRLAFFAVAAAAVRNVEGHYDSIALFEESHARAEFFDYAHVLVTFKKG
jgi:hypothetical protein